MPTITDTFDLLILGAGPGGYVAALDAASKGLSVCVFEERELGGTCLNRGCIPTKALVGVAERYRSIQGAKKLGIMASEATLDPEAIWEFQEGVTSRLRKGIESLFTKQGVTLVSGRATLRTATDVLVTGHDGRVSEYHGRHVILATGSQPRVFTNWQVDGQTVLTSDEALNLRSIPESLVVIGGGYIGCEFASIFAALGSKVTILEGMPEILPMVDSDLTKRLKSYLKRQRITIKTGVMVQSVQVQDGCGLIDTADGQFSGEKVLISVGRVPNTSGLGLESVGIAINQRGEVEVDDRLRTSVTGIYAIGDLTNQPYKLAHVASKQAEIAIENILGKDVSMDYSAVPSAIFTSPEVAAVGLTEQQARGRGYDPVVGMHQFTANGKALALNDNRGLIKIVATPEGQPVGVHILGPHASDLLPEAVLALAQRVPVAEWAKLIRAHPSLGETTAEALTAVFGKPTLS